MRTLKMQKQITVLIDVLHRWTRVSSFMYRY
jgi:hypothetical protein